LIIHANPNPLRIQPITPLRSSRYDLVEKYVLQLTVAWRISEDVLEIYPQNEAHFQVADITKAQEN